MLPITVVASTEVVLAAKRKISFEMSVCKIPIMLRYSCGSISRC